MKNKTVLFFFAFLCYCKYAQGSDSLNGKKVYIMPGFGVPNYKLLYNGYDEYQDDFRSSNFKVSKAPPSYNMHLFLNMDIDITKHIFISTELGKFKVSKRVSVSYSYETQSSSTSYTFGDSVLGNDFIKSSEYISLGVGYALHHKMKGTATWRSYAKLRFDINYTEAYFPGEISQLYVNNKGQQEKTLLYDYRIGNQGFQNGYTGSIGTNININGFGLWTEVRYQQMNYIGSGNSQVYGYVALTGFEFAFGTSIELNRK